MVECRVVVVEKNQSILNFSKSSKTLHQKRKVFYFDVDFCPKVSNFRSAFRKIFEFFQRQISHFSHNKPILAINPIETCPETTKFLRKPIQIRLLFCGKLGFNVKFFLIFSTSFPKKVIRTVFS